METEKKLWFKAKYFGWGWTPVSWQGWIILALYVLGIISNFVLAGAGTSSAQDTVMGFGLNLVIMTIFLLVICYAKGEKPKWRWGKTEEKKTSEDVL